MGSLSLVFLVFVLVEAVVWVKPSPWMSLVGESSSKLFISSLSAFSACSGDGVARPSWLGGVWTSDLSVWQPLMSTQLREFKEHSLTGTESSKEVLIKRFLMLPELQSCSCVRSHLSNVHLGTSRRAPSSRKWRPVLEGLAKVEMKRPRDWKAACRTWNDATLSACSRFEVKDSRWCN